jgi:hypothetical protein
VILSHPKVFRYVAGGDPRFVPFKPRVKFDDDQLEAMRMVYDGSAVGCRTGGALVPGAGLKAMGRALGCAGNTVRYHLRKIAERAEG